MAVYEIYRQQLLSGTIENVWSFFSNPHNLATLTPDYMQFQVTSRDYGDEIYPGQIITYKVAPLLGVSLFWMTEITHVHKGRLFVDEQRKGPYRIWHHQHLFEEINNGVRMTDIVHYELPLGFIGNLTHSLFIKSQLEDIFDYRRKKVDDIFGTVSNFSVKELL